MRHKLACLSLAAVMLSACQTTRYVTVPCVTKDQELPAEPDSVKDKLTGKADEDTRVLAGGLLRWKAYGQGMRQIVEGCRR